MAQGRKEDRVAFRLTPRLRDALVRKSAEMSTQERRVVPLSEVIRRGLEEWLGIEVEEEEDE